MRFEVWAPRASRVELELRGTRVAMQPGEGGWFAVEAEAAAGTDYAFALDGGQALPDPRSNWQPAGVHGPSRLVDHRDFVWTDAGWRPPALRELVMYELHTGTFTPGGTFEAAVERLPHLRDLGVNAVELMPVAEFAGTRNWGYDGVDLYAPHHAYGGPDGLKTLVDACHARGLAVILDVVYNHLGPEGSYLTRFGPYLTPRLRTPWGHAIDFGQRAVRDFVLGNAAMWLRDYHLDGLRLDAVHAIVDDSPRHILAELAASLPEGHPLIAESPLIDPRLTGDYGLDAQWNDDFHHALHVLLTGERQSYYAPFGRVEQLAHQQLVERPERFVVYAQNHDQVGNRAAGDRLPASLLRLAAPLILLAPSEPLLFMGQEWGASTPFQFFSDHGDAAVARATVRGRIEEFSAFGWRPEDVPDPQDPATFERSRLDWRELEKEPHRSLLEWHRRLLAARPALLDQPVEANVSGRRLTLRRGAMRAVCDFAALTAVVTGLPQPAQHP